MFCRNISTWQEDLIFVFVMANQSGAKKIKVTIALGIKKIFFSILVYIKKAYP